MRQCYEVCEDLSLKNDGQRDDALRADNRHREDAPLFLKSIEKVKSEAEIDDEEREGNEVDDSPDRVRRGGIHGFRDIQKGEWTIEKSERFSD
jgi:hypothetical protein